MVRSKMDRSPTFELLEARTLFSVAAGPLPVVSIVATDPAAAEVGDTQASFTVSSSLAPTVDMPVYFAIGGSAANGKDYVAIAKQVIIPAGQTSATIPITVNDDNLLELTENIILTIKPTSSYTADPAASSAKVTIADNELPTVNVKAARCRPSEAGGLAKFVVSRNGPRQEALNVTFSLDGTAVNGQDYAELQNIVIPVGKSSVVVTLTPIDDAIAEGPETIQLNILNSPTQLAGVRPSATLTIADNDLDVLSGLHLGGTISANYMLKGSLKGVGTLSQGLTGGSYDIGFTAGNNSADAYFSSDANGVYLNQTSRYINWDYDSNLYLTPVQVLPSMMTLGQVYTYSGPFDGGTVQIQSRFLGWQTIATSTGPVTTAKVQINIVGSGDGWTTHDSFSVWLNDGIVRWAQSSKSKTFGASAGYSFSAVK